MPSPTPPPGKRIAILCDGTWNKSDAINPTNVVQLANAIESHDDSGIPQLVFYLEGVGAGRGAGRVGKFMDRSLGGMFGWGLLENIKDAYRQLIFNYEPGDEVHVFGFSRGAYTARSLVGLIRKAGILPRDRVNEINSAFDLYRLSGDMNRPDLPHILEERRRLSPVISTSETEFNARQRQGYLLKIAYLGVWDTVGALGVPSMLGPLARWANRKYTFHDTELTSMVRAARHAVSIDELRATFPPALWENLNWPPEGQPRPKKDPLNVRHPAVPPRYEQRWFAGDHGSIGGGGDFHGLSNITLRYIAEGAARAGLRIAPKCLSFHPNETDLCEPVINVYHQPPLKKALSLIKKPRMQLTDHRDVADEVVERLALIGHLYRPETLDKVRPQLEDRIRAVWQVPGPGA